MFRYTFCVRIFQAECVCLEKMCVGGRVCGKESGVGPSMYSSNDTRLLTRRNMLRSGSLTS